MKFEIQQDSTKLEFARWATKGYDDLKNSDEESEGDYRVMYEDLELICKPPAKRKSNHSCIEFVLKRCS